MKRIFLCVAVVLLLLVSLFNLGWSLWNLRGRAAQSTSGGRFRTLEFHTNNAVATEVVERDNEQPVLIMWDLDGHGKPDVVSYFFEGTNVFNLHLNSKQGQKLGYDVIFYGPGRSQAWWWDHGSGEFNERMLYDTNGNLSEHQVWYAGQWQHVQRREDKNGIIADGGWHHLRLGTNGVWSLDELSAYK